MDAPATSFIHPKSWLVKRIRHLSSVTAIDIAAYAIMSNHYLLALHVNQHQHHSWAGTFKSHVKQAAKQQAN
jgi:hypothetical protein